MPGVRTQAFAAQYDGRRLKALEDGIEALQQHLDELKRYRVVWQEGTSDGRPIAHLLVREDRVLIDPAEMDGESVEGIVRKALAVRYFGGPSDTVRVVLVAPVIAD